MNSEISDASIGIVGAGAFGTALACVVGANGTATALYGRNSEAMAHMRASRVNPRLPKIPLPASVEPKSDFNSISGHDYLLLVVPSSAQIEIAKELASRIKTGCTIVMCAKGLDKTTGGTITQRLAKVLPEHPIAVLSGPGFAADIALGLPTAMTLAASNLSVAETTTRILSRKAFRLYASDDVTGVQIGGALKNVLAIASGIVMGARLGESARAALIARGLAELTRFVTASGGKQETAAGLSGLGDLVLTATSKQSRNYQFGISLGEGAVVSELIGEGRPLVEGAAAAITAKFAASALSVPMPITDAVAAIVSGTADVATLSDRLLSRPLRNETA